jgi:hypothetical protein
VALIRWFDGKKILGRHGPNRDPTKDKNKNFNQVSETDYSKSNLRRQEIERISYFHCKRYNNFFGALFTKKDKHSA